MSIELKQLEELIEHLAPARYAYDWDNSGVTIETHGSVGKALVCLDVTEETIGMALAEGCDTIVSHHPLLFRAVKKLRTGDPVTGLAIRAIEMGLNLIAVHTPFDLAPDGINGALADRIGLGQREPFAVEQRERCAKVTVFAPRAEEREIKEAMFAAGAGRQGQYARAAFCSEGRGSFLPLAGAHPARGNVGEEEQVEEVRIEVMCPAELAAQVAAAARAAHSYEQPAIDVMLLDAPAEAVSLGVIGNLPEAVAPDAFAALVRDALGAQAVKTGGAARPVRRVACIGGAAGEYFAQAAHMGADAFVVGEAKYNHFLEAKRAGILLVEAGHYHTESAFVKTMCDGLQKRAHALQYKIEFVAAENVTIPYQMV